MPQTSFDMTIDTGENQLRFFRSTVLNGDTDRIPSKSPDDVVDEERLARAACLRVREFLVGIRGHAAICGARYHRRRVRER